ncbi:hypothetical protein [Paenibacillus tyrfis]|nr:hypothetical protein [Paenibacillus tyrfis]
MKAYFLALVIALGLFGTAGPFVPGPSDGSMIKPLDQHGSEG